MTDLFAPLTLRGLTLANRIGVSPMCQYCCAEDGKPTDWHLAHLVSRAVGGAGLVFTEATAVTAEGRITPQDLGLWEDAQLPSHTRLAAAITAAGSVPGIQLAHAGRKASRNPPWNDGEASPGWTKLGPSALAMPGMAPPRAMSEGEIGATITAFAAAARRAVAAGYRIIELHGAHGYLLHSFFSPLANTRNDGWGGDFAGRTRLTRAITEAIRAAVPADYPIAVRLSCTDWLPGGWTIEDSVALALELKRLGADLLDCSSGGIQPGAPIPVGPGYQVPGARAIRAGAGIATAAVGMITEPEQAQAILANGDADMVLLARALLREPYWPLRAAAALGRMDAVRAAPQYERGWSSLGKVAMALPVATPMRPL